MAANRTIAAGAGAGGKRAHRRWNKAAERAFLGGLAMTANVTASAGAADLAVSTIYARRQSHPGFREAWVSALNEGYAMLEAEMLKRAIAGTEKPVWSGKQQIGLVTQYSDNVGIAMLKLNGEARHRHEVELRRARDEEEGVRARFMARLQEIHDRLNGDVAPAADEAS